jgi:FkbM family methyltransferase
MMPASIYRRLKQFSADTGLVRSPLDWLSFTVLMLARSRLPTLLFLGRLFPELVVRPPLLGGLRLALNPWDASHMIVFHEVFRAKNYDLELIPFTPDQIFDCGGHIGMFSLLARSRYPTVPLVIFEPNPHNVAWIHRQMQLNTMKIEVVQAAVSAHEGEAIFQDRLSYSGHLLGDSTSAIPNAKAWNPASSAATQARGPAKGRYIVRLIDLPAALSRRRPERLLLKLDVEGEETHIIPALFDVLPRVAAVFFETHHGENGWDWAKQQFTNHGFAVERRRSIYDFNDGFALRL